MTSQSTRDRRCLSERRGDKPPPTSHPEPHQTGLRHITAGVALPYRVGAGRAALLALLALIVLGGCRLELQGSAEPAWPRAVAPDSVITEATPIPTRPAGQHFGDVHHYRDGLDVRVFEIRTAVLGWFPDTSDEGAKDGDPYTVIRIQLDNNSRADFNPGLEGGVLYGPQLDDAGTVNLVGATSDAVIAPGGSASYDLGFLIPDEFRDDVVFELSVDAGEREKAYFVGSVRTG